MKSSQSSPSLYLTKLMVQNFFFWYTIPEYILHSLPYPVVLGVGSRSTSPKGDWDSRATSAADTPPLGFTSRILMPHIQPFSTQLLARAEQLATKCKGVTGMIQKESCGFLSSLHPRVSTTVAFGAL